MGECRVKKWQLRDDLARARERAEDAELRASNLAAEVGRLKGEIENMRKHWQPIPIPHKWQPRLDGGCKLCDEPRDAPRHGEGGPAMVIVVKVAVPLRLTTRSGDR